MTELNFKPRLQVLDQDQVDRIHSATCHILSHTGVCVTHPRARELFAGAGAVVESDRIKIPRDLLEQTIDKVPSQVILGNRHGEPAVTLEKDASWFGATLDDIYYLDPVTGIRRQMTLEDTRSVVSLSDALPNLTWGMTFGTISDVPAQMADRYAARQALIYSEKPVVVSSNSADNLADIIEMAKAVVTNEKAFGQAPPLASFVTTLSPLVLPDHVVDQMLLAAEEGIPQVVYNGIQAGSTAPMSFAGAVAQGNAETLAGLTLIQLARKNSPVIFGSFSTIMDMRSSIFSFGAPEMNLMIAAHAQIARHYDIPFYGAAGCSDAKLPDSQAAAEAMFSCFSSAMTGANLVHDTGLLEYGTMICPEQMVLVNELLHLVGQYMGGLPVSDETLALDVIDAVGPGGHYLGQQHTLAHFKDVYYSGLFDRKSYPTWTSAGAKTLATRNREQTLALMSQKPAMLDPVVLKELDRMCGHWK